VTCEMDVPSVDVRVCLSRFLVKLKDLNTLSIFLRILSSTFLQKDLSLLL